jgi:hypothetical protein
LGFFLRFFFAFFSQSFFESTTFVSEC